MRYDWDWYYSKAPFLKIMQEECDLKVQKQRIYDDCWLPISHYIVELDRNTFEKNFRLIQHRLLKTPVCKNNQEVREVIEGFDDPMNALKNVIIQGCIPNCHGSIEYVFKKGWITMNREELVKFLQNKGIEFTGIEGTSKRVAKTSTPYRGLNNEDLLKIETVETPERYVSIKRRQVKSPKKRVEEFVLEYECDENGKMLFAIAEPDTVSVPYGELLYQGDEWADEFVVIGHEDVVIPKGNYTVWAKEGVLIFEKRPISIA